MAADLQNLLALFRAGLLNAFQQLRHLSRLSIEKQVDTYGMAGSQMPGAKRFHLRGNTCSRCIVPQEL